MQSTTTTTTTPPPRDAGRWSFRRFGADAEAQATSDTWDDIYRHGPALVAEIDRRKGDLYEAEATLTGPIDANIAGLPNKATLRAVRQRIRATTREMLESAGGAEEGADGTVHLRMPVEQWRRFCELAEQMDGLARALFANVQSGAEAVQNTQKSLKKLDTQLREFITTVWDLNSERAKAFPPFFTDLGPLHASVYGMGCMTTTSTPAKPKPH